MCGGGGRDSCTTGAIQFDHIMSVPLLRTANPMQQNVLSEWIFERKGGLLSLWMDGNPTAIVDLPWISPLTRVGT